LNVFNTIQKLTGICFLVLAGSQYTYAQDPSFAQFVNYRVYLNPATTGSEKGLNVAMIYKNQWAYVPGGFNTYGVALDVQSSRLSSGVGMIAYRDVEAKALTTNYIGASYAYIIRISKGFNLHIGVLAAFANKKLDASRLIFSDQLDPEIGVLPGGGGGTGVPLRSVNYFDLDAGLLARFRFKLGKHYAHNSVGFAVHHLTRPDESFLNIETKVPMRFTVHYGSMFPIVRGKYKRGDPNFYLSPVFKFDFQQKLQVYTTGFYSTFKPVYAGVMYQLNKFSGSSTNGIIFTGGVDWDLGADNAVTMNVGYSYQMDFTGVTTKSQGQHEVSLRMNFNYVQITSPKKKKGKKIDCYEFEGKKAVKLF
jgi:type IX secretion system PorP/SprF family membrane protein